MLLSTQLAKYPHVLYVKPSNKVYVFMSPYKKATRSQVKDLPSEEWLAGVENSHLFSMPFVCAMIH